MAGRDPRVDAYVANAAEFARPILDRLRQIVHSVLPDVEEGIKWGMPHFMIGGKNVAGMAAFKSHCAFVLHHLERGQGDGMGSYGKLQSISDVPSEAALAPAIRAGRDRVLAAKTVKRSPPTAKVLIPVPDDFAELLIKAPAAKSHFDSFTEAQRRDYLEWIVSAKRDDTRKRRMDSAIEWIAEGKHRNWKYGG